MEKIIYSSNVQDIIDENTLDDLTDEEVDDMYEKTYYQMQDIKTDIINKIKDFVSDNISILILDKDEPTNIIKILDSANMLFDLKINNYSISEMKLIQDDINIYLDLQYMNNKQKQYLIKFAKNDDIELYGNFNIKNIEKRTIDLKQIIRA